MGNHSHIKNNNGLGTLSILSYGKTNLFLHITGVLPRGYHRVLTLMTKIDIFDHITITPLPSGNTKDIVVFASSSSHMKKQTIASLNAMESNVGGTSVSKIVHILRQEYGDAMGLKNQIFHIIVEKNIPTGSGLGGSSSNAHATLEGVLHLVSSSLTYCIKHELLKQIGADAPFFLHHKPQLCHGRGDEFLRGVNLPQDMSLIVVVPNSSNLTPLVYGDYALLNNDKKYGYRDRDVFSDILFGADSEPDSLKAISDDYSGISIDSESSRSQERTLTAHTLSLLMENDLLDSALSVNPELKELWSILYTKVKAYNNSHGDNIATLILNGSGSSVALVCFNMEASQHFATELERLFPNYYVKKHLLVQSNAKVHTLLNNPYGEDEMDCKNNTQVL